MPSAIPASPETILAAVKAQLIAATGIPSHRILILARDDAPVPKFNGPPDILLKLGPTRPDPNFGDNMGRVCALVRRPLAVIVRVRDDRDQQDRDDILTTDSDTGLNPLETRVISALHIFWPSDATGNALTQCPLHWVEGGGLTRENQKVSGWGQAVLFFQLLYQSPTPGF
jgi:hypothetical protein